MKYLTLMLTLILIAADAMADRTSYHADLSVGTRSDSSVASTDTDRLAGEADMATLVEAGLGAKFSLGESMRLELDYDFASTDYRELDAFDLELHHARAAMGRQFGATDASLGVDHFRGVLDGDDYLTLTQVSPAVSHLFGRSLFLRAAWTATETRYEQLDTRDASGEAIRADLYWLLDGMRHFVALGLENGADDAIDDAFDYDNRTAIATWGYRFAAASTAPAVRVQLRYEERDYAQPLADGADRVDERLRARLSAVLPMTDFLSVTALVERTRNDSPLDNAKLDRTVYGVELGLSF